MDDPVVVTMDDPLEVIKDDPEVVIMMDDPAEVIMMDGSAEVTAGAVDNPLEVFVAAVSQDDPAQETAALKKDDPVGVTAAMLKDDSAEVIAAQIKDDSAKVTANADPAEKAGAVLAAIDAPVEASWTGASWALNQWGWCWSRYSLS